jgi:hypothetical protein
MVAKIGDSITESAGFLRCLADDDTGFEGLDWVSLAASRLRGDRRGG